MTTVQEDIVAMVATHSKRKPKDHGFGDNKKSKFSLQVPPFITHFQDSAGVKHKLGDSKEFNSMTFYFCDCPDHYNCLKWHTHTHTHEKYRTRIKWLERQGTSSNSTGDASAHLGADTSSDNKTATTTNTPSVKPTNTSSLNDETPSVQALLASAMNIVPDREVIRDMIAEVLNTTAEL